MNMLKIKPIAVACTIAIATATTPLMANTDDKEYSDTWTKASLTTTYTLNRHLNPFDIDTEVKDGVVTLRGSVESKVERDLAEQLALGVDGVHKVVNELKIDPEPSDKMDSANAEDKASGSDTERSFMQVVEDANTTAMVKSQLLWNGETEGLSINVDTLHGVVSLSGSVDSKAEAELAEQIAISTEDVRKVENHLKVGGDPATMTDKAKKEVEEAGEEVSDAWITTKVKSALLYNRHVDGTDINVDTEQGSVTLQGHVDSDYERNKAIAIARSVKGVKSVKSELNPMK